MSQTKYSPSGEHIWTPLHLILLQEAYIDKVLWPHQKAPAVSEYRDHLWLAGLISIGRLHPGQHLAFSITDKGKNLIDRLCNVPAEVPPFAGMDLGRGDITVVQVPGPGAVELARTYSRIFSEQKDQVQSLQRQLYCQNDSFQQALHEKEKIVHDLKEQLAKAETRLKEEQEAHAFAIRASNAIALERDQLKEAVRTAKDALNGPGACRVLNESAKVSVSDPASPMKFPVLLGWEGVVVLATSERSGYVIKSNHLLVPVGKFFDETTPRWKVGGYRPYQGDFPKLLKRGDETEPTVIALDHVRGYAIDRGTPRFDYDFTGSQTRWSDLGYTPFYA